MPRAGTALVNERDPSVIDLEELLEQRNAEQLEKVPLDALWPSPLNPRKSFPVHAIEELAASIAADGLLQYPTVRAAADPDQPEGIAGQSQGREVYVGGKRLRALMLLASTGRWPERHLPGRQVPVIRRDVDDRELLTLAVKENINRTDMHPLEEGEAFATMLDRDPDLTTDIIGTIYGKTRRWVQERVRMARDLAPKARDLYRAGGMTLAQARALSRAALPEQQGMIERYGPSLMTWTAENIANQIDRLYPLESAAIFDPAEYTGAWIQGAWIQGENDTGKHERRFADIGQFRQLQQAALDRRLTELASGWIDRLDARYHGTWWKPTTHGQYEKAPNHADPATAGTVVLLSEDLFDVRIFENLIRLSKSSATDTADDDKAIDPVKAIGPKRVAYRLRRQTEALQIVLADNQQLALARCALALLGGTTDSHIDLKQQWHDGHAVHPELVERLQSWRRRIDPDGSLCDQGNSDDSAAATMLRLQPASPYLGTTFVGHSAAQIAMLDRLMAISVPHLTALIADLTAARCYVSSVSFGAGVGNVDTTAALAKTASVDILHHWQIDAEYLDLLKGDELHTLSLKINTWCAIRGLPPIDIKELQAAKVKDRRIIIAGHVTDHDVRLIPPEMDFGDQETVAKAVREF